eukprot:g32515.t1
MPSIFKELLSVRSQLEAHYKDMQDIEFTIQQGKLYMLQTRNGKRTAPAALQIAVDMAKEGLISKSQALMSLKPDLIDQLLHPTLDPKAKKEVIAKGLPASPGAAGGKVVFSADEAVRRSKDGDKVILVRIETSPDDIHGLHAAEGVLTTRGGMTSHAAVVARGMGRPCVAGAGGITVDYAAAKLTVGSVTVTEGQILTIDGSTGEVMVGEVPTVPPQLSGSFGIIMEWADEVRDMKVRANAETPADARQAKEFGAEGIGLVRTEHMFFEGQRIVAMRQMILATDENDRRQALEKLLVMQREDITELFKIMDGMPVTVRLLDPPLHEFIPHTEAEMASVAKAAGVPLDRVRRRAAELQEANPMLGHRGCRLAITYPEICEMQARAIFEAAAEVGRSSKKLPVAEVMVPLVATTEELKLLKGVIEKTADAVKKEQGITFTYKVGTMIELPRAALQAGKLAEMAEFFSFGTNDLTQTTYGLSRDDAGSFLPEYKAKGIVEQDPFVSLDPDGVGELITMAVQRGRSTRPDMKMGICGEHGHANGMASKGVQAQKMVIGMCSHIFNVQLQRSELRKKGVESLQRAGIDADEAKSSVKWMLQELERRGKPDQETFMHWVHRRAKREPLQYILGSWPFYPLPIELLVRAPVLIPRPETEELVDLVISEVQINNLWPNRSWPLRIVDFGSGSGAMILALLHTWPKATGMAVDPAEAAIALTSENALRCGVKERLSLFHGTAKEFAEAWSGDDFDLIVSNPPYIPSLEIPNLQPDVRDFEDHGALDGGQDGLVVVAEVLQTARAVGEVGARIFLEVHHTHPSVFEALEERAAPSLLAALEGLRLVQTVHDAYGQPRFVVLEVLDKALARFLGLNVSWGHFGPSVRGKSSGGFKREKALHVQFS